jgi:hypothetical protein
MLIVPAYRDFFTFLDRLAAGDADPWSPYRTLYLDSHRAFLEAYWQQCFDLPVKVWQQRVEAIRPEHYAELRALLSSFDIEAAVADAVSRCQALLPAPDPTVVLMIGFFSPDAFTIQVGDDWQIGLGLERLRDPARVPLLVAHEYAHWYRHSHQLAQTHTLLERLIEEGLATQLSMQAYLDRPLAQHLFVSEARLRELQQHQEELLALARAQADITDEEEIQHFLYGNPLGPNTPQRAGSFIGYLLVAKQGLQS